MSMKIGLTKFDRGSTPRTHSKSFALELDSSRSKQSFIYYLSYPGKNEFRLSILAAYSIVENVDDGKGHLLSRSKTEDRTVLWSDTTKTYRCSTSTTSAFLFSGMFVERSNHIQPIIPFFSSVSGSTSADKFLFARFHPLESVDEFDQLSPLVGQNADRVEYVPLRNAVTCQRRDNSVSEDWYQLADRSSHCGSVSTVRLYVSMNIFECNCNWRR